MHIGFHKPPSFHYCFFFRIFSHLALQDGFFGYIRNFNIQGTHLSTYNLQLSLTYKKPPEFGGCHHLCETYNSTLNLCCFLIQLQYFKLPDLLVFGYVFEVIKNISNTLLPNRHGNTLREKITSLSCYLYYTSHNR